MQSRKICISSGLMIPSQCSLEPGNKKMWGGGNIYIYIYIIFLYNSVSYHVIYIGEKNLASSMLHYIFRTFFSLRDILGTSLVAQWLRIACQCRGHRLESWSWKIPHAAEQLSPCATTTEPTCHNY